MYYYSSSSSQMKCKTCCFSRALLQPLLDVNLSDEAFPYMTTKLVKVAGHMCRAVRISFVGEIGWELHIPWDSCRAVYKAIWDQGKRHALRHAGYRALTSLSCEKGTTIGIRSLHLHVMRLCFLSHCLCCNMSNIVSFCMFIWLTGRNRKHIVLFISFNALTFMQLLNIYH